MTPQKRVEIALRGSHSNVVPFTMYENMIMQCEAERNMRNNGLCIVQRMGVFTVKHPNVKTKQEIYWENGKRFTRTHYETPAGNLATLDEAAGFTSWHHEKMFKTPDDYKAILSFVQDECAEPSYDAFARAEKNFGEDAIFRPGFGLEPLQTLISSSIMDMQDFCVQWMENRDEILKIYNIIVENRRKVYPIVAQSPALHANYGGNVVPSIIGPETFEQYYGPHYNEAAEVMHKHGKLIGCHFDDNCKLISEAIGQTDLDYIEAFTPAPDTDMTLGEARQAWPGKVLWLNFPSSVHLKPDAKVEQTTVDMLNQVQSIDGIIMGITEDIPPDRWQNSCTAIMDGLERHAREKPELYR